MFKYFQTKILFLGIFIFVVLIVSPNVSEASSFISVGSGPFFSTLVGTKLYVNNVNSDNISVIDTLTNTVSATISVGDYPYSFTLVGTNLYVNNWISDNISVIDTNTDIISTTITIGTNPIYSTRVGTKLYVNDGAGNSVSVIDSTDNIITTTIPVGNNPFFSTLVGTKLYVNNSNSNNVSVIDTTNNTIIATIPVGTSPLYSTLVGTNLYVDNSNSNNVSVINTLTNTVSATISVGNAPQSSTLVGTNLYVNTSNSTNVSVINTTNNSVTTIPVGTNPIYSTLVGTSLYVNNYNSFNVSVIDTTNNTVITTIPTGGTSTNFSTLVGTKLYVTNINSNNISVIDTTNNTVVTFPVNLSNTVVGTTLTLTYDEPLDETSIPAVGDFVVYVNNTPVVVSAINISGATVVLTLANPIVFGDDISIDYTKGATPIKDLTGPEINSFESYTVINQTPGTRVVNSLLDDGNGNCTLVKCTLRDAIANSQGGGNIIFDVTGAITLTQSNQMNISHNLNITGPGASNLTIDFGGNDGIHHTHGDLSISGITITNGDAPIYESSDGTLNISDVIFSENNQDDLEVLYLESSSGVTISNSQFISNSADDNAGAIYDGNGDLTITDTTFSNNVGYYTGGITFFGNNLTINNSTFNNNSTDSGYGGAIDFGGSNLSITNSTFDQNSNPSGSGGAIYVNSGNTTITNSTFLNNIASNGNAIYNDGGTVTIVNSILSGTNNCFGTITSLGHNIDSDGSCNFNTDGDISNPKNFNSLHSFDEADGSSPYYGSLTESNGVFYGMTERGGANNQGTIFSYNPANIGSEYTVLHSFDGTNGSNPKGSLTESNGVFYGMTYNGGANGYGTIFSYNPGSIGSEYTVLHSFDGTNGGYPYGSLTESNGVFYGMTVQGGANSAGTIFSYDPMNIGGEFTILHSFEAIDGYPFGSLTLYNGNLYGLTSNDGGDGHAVIFSYNPSSHSYTRLYALNGTSDGAYPYGSLTESNGIFYGMTYNGGANSSGTIFSYNPANLTQLFNPARILDPQGLKDNSGPVQTIALLKGSIAIDAGDDNSAPTTDARGYARVGVSDIGAYEYIHKKVLYGSYAPGYGSNVTLPTPTITIPTPTVTPTITPSTNPKFIFTKTLKFGMTDSDVLELQKFLNANGYTVANTGAGSAGHETNYFGNATKLALIKFQKANNITPFVGFFGPITRGVVNNLIK